MPEKHNVKARDIIEKFYNPRSKAYEILLRHGELVANKAIDVAGKVAHLNPDLDFIREAAMLHDIGIFLTGSLALGCTGTQPYICHGYLGRELLEETGLTRHALVCERHLGVGISAQDIRRHTLPLPERDMLPISIEEQIVCFADKFFSKNATTTASENSVDDILRNLEPHGEDKVAIFKSWVNLFGL
ncbi:HD domain-containing protein [Thermodesulfobacteriota bacterium]